MQADVFYKTDSKKAIPLCLISQNQWEHGMNTLSSLERNYFSDQFKGLLGQHCVNYDADGIINKAFIGTGPNNQESALAHAALVLPPASYLVEGPLTQRAALNWGLAQYKFTAYKEHDLKPRVLVLSEELLEEVSPLIQSIYLIRDLINTPANDLGPIELAQAVERLALTYKAELKQWIGAELAEQNFPAIHMVGRASVSKPRLVCLTWGNEKDPHITLIGKGVCFDSGGLDLKPSSAMRLMKKDMGGAAQVLGLAQWIMMKQLPVYLRMYVPAVENSVGPEAFRPGDVVKMRNGMTVEVDNTDAEGRLILADTMVKACEDKPELIIDFATLTGAARVAVGTEIAAMFTNNEELAAALYSASAKALDPIWRLPLFPGYESLLHSDIADLANASPSPYAGAITAGLFLQHFIDSEIPWVHFDVMAWNTSSKAGKPEGGEAMGFGTIAEYLLQTYGKRED